MKTRILNLLLILTSLLGYLEWGNNNHGFLFQLEGVVLAKLFTDPLSAAHPFTLIPLAGQVVLCITLFQQRPSRVLTLIGLCSLSLLLLLLLAIGMMSLNIRIAGSAIPFLIVAVLSIVSLRKG